MKKIKFMQVDLYITDEVFTPRPETELLVNVTLYALSVLGLAKKTSKILDIGTGSGNIAISLTKLNRNCKLITLDVDSEALKVAKSNATLNSVTERIAFIKSDLFSALTDKHRNSFDIIVSNPPYVARWEISTLSDVVQGQPRIAIDGGEDGLSYHRKICAESPIYLKPGGFLVMEMGYNQLRFVEELLKKDDNFTDFEVFKDPAGIPRVIMARYKET